MKHILILALVITSCIGVDDHHGNSTNNKQIGSEDTSHYEILFNDIDPFSLNGIGKIEGNAVYPCIGITAIGDTQRNVNYYRGKDDKLAVSYKKLDSCWMSVREKDIDTNYYVYYEYIFPKKMLGLTYESNDHYQFPILVVGWSYEDNAETSYDLRMSKAIPPSPSALADAQAAAKYVTRKNFQAKGDITEVQEVSINTEKKLTEQKTTCYTTKGRSYLYFSYFGADTVSCRKRN